MKRECLVVRDVAKINIVSFFLGSQDYVNDRHTQPQKSYVRLSSN